MNQRFAVMCLINVGGKTLYDNCGTVTYGNQKENGETDKDGSNGTSE